MIKERAERAPSATSHVNASFDFFVSSLPPRSRQILKRQNWSHPRSMNLWDLQDNIFPPRFSIHCICRLEVKSTIIFSSKVCATPAAGATHGTRGRGCDSRRSSLSPKSLPGGLVVTYNGTRTLALRLLVWVEQPSLWGPNLNPRGQQANSETSFYLETMTKCFVFVFA